MNNSSPASPPRAKLCYYITGHGYGHATRSLKVVETLITKENFDVHVVSSEKTIAFIRSTLSPSILDKMTTHERQLDAGAVQQDALTIDPLKSLQNYNDDIHSHHSELVSAEAEFLRSNGIHMVCVDCTPVACRAAAEAKCKACIVSNFTWDYIYSEMLNDVRSSITDNEISAFEAMLVQCGYDFNCADAYIRLPGATPLPIGFNEAKVLPGPLISRLPTRSREEIYFDLAIPLSKKVLLLCFGGGHNHTFHLQDSFLPEGWVCVVLAGPDRKPSELADAGLSTDRFFTVPSDCYLPDLINAADCVLGKIGYGFVSECLATKTPLVYISRSHWAEEQFLKSHLESTGLGVLMILSDFDNGNWEKYLLTAEDINATMKNSDSKIQSGLKAISPDLSTAADTICSVLRNMMLSEVSCFN